MENNLQELISWFVNDVEFEITEKDVEELRAFYSNASNDDIVNDFSYMHESESNFKSKMSEIKINNLINWFVNDTKNTINVTNEDKNTLLYYYKNNQRMTPDKLVDDFALMHENETNFRNHISKISSEIINVIDLKDNDNSKYIKLIYGNNSSKIYPNIIGESGNFIFNSLIEKEEDINKFFEDKFKDTEEIPKEQEANLQLETTSNNTGLSNQKKLGTHPAGGTRFSWLEEGFMNLLFFIFLTGIGTGIVIMTIMNLLNK